MLEKEPFLSFLRMQESMYSRFRNKYGMTETSRPSRSRNTLSPKYNQVRGSPIRLRSGLLRKLSVVPSRLLGTKSTQFILLLCVFLFMVTKKNSEKETANSINWVQVATLIISIFGIGIGIVWIYLTWIVTKTNEIETRQYNEKYELYKNIWKAIVEYNNEWKDKTYPERARILERKLLNLWFEIRIVWSPEVICAYWYLLWAMSWYIEFTTKESPTHWYTDFWRDVIPMIFDLEKAMRQDLADDHYLDILELEVDEDSLEWMAIWLPRCSSSSGSLIIPLQQYR